MRREAQAAVRLRARPRTATHGHFFAPQLFELDASISCRREEFGPILHVVALPSGELPQVMDGDPRAPASGSPSACTAASRAWSQHVFRALPVGNTYVNRNMIGAVVGVQPFGGQGLSGTGPKAGGAALPAALRDGADAHHQHRRDRRQRGAAFVAH